MNTSPCHPGKHKLAPDIEEYLRRKIAATSIIRLSRLLSSGPETLLALVDVGAAENTRDRIEMRVAGLMLAEGLKPTLRPEGARAAVRKRGKPKEDRGWFGLSRDLRAKNVCQELDGVRIGQVWMIVQPNGKEVRVTVRRLLPPNLEVHPPTVARAVGVTASGKHRVLWIKGLKKAARLLEDAPSKAG